MGGMAAAGGLMGALAAASCCILPVALFTLGVSGAWIANFTQLAPYKPYIAAATLAFLGTGYWLVYRSYRIACANSGSCARPLSSRIVMTTLVVATVLVAAAIGFDFVAPYVLDI